MNHKGHNRSSSHGRKLASRQSKPPPLQKRGQSYNHLPTQSQNATQFPRPTLGGSRRVVTEVTDDKDNADATDEMAGFLQFCPTCDKQIITPGNSVLYCSEACRRRDVSMPTPPVQPSLPPASSYFDIPAADIVPQRSPTVIRPVSLTFSDLSISDVDSHPLDTDRDYIEAVNHFGRHQTFDDNAEMLPGRRSQTNRASVAFESGMPSLSNSPSSSFGTAGSWSSYRPLPPRHDPSTGHFPNKSIDLVIPTFPTTAPSSPAGFTSDSSLKSSASTVTSFRVTEAADVSFDRRRPSRRDAGRTSSSLKEFLSQDVRRAT